MEQPKLSRIGGKYARAAPPLCVGVVTDCARVDRERVRHCETVVRGYHTYMEVWDAAVGQVLPCQQEFGSEVLVRSTLPFLLAKAGLLD